MRVPVIEIKQGDSLRLYCKLIVQLTRLAQPMAGWQVDSSVRGPGGRLVAQLKVDALNPTAATYELVADPDQTRSWPADLLDVDVRYVDSTGRVMHTDTFHIRVFRSVTLPR